MVSGEPIGLANWNYKVQLVFPIEVQHSSWLPINAIWDQFMGTGMTSWTHSLFLTGLNSCKFTFFEKNEKKNLKTHSFLKKQHSNLIKVLINS